mgnify:CR=1 FL=1
MGLPGSGKTTLAKQLCSELNYTHLNADEIRKKYNDWDFTYEGRKRQASRMKTLSVGINCILDFVCPLPEFIDMVSPDILIWMDTIKSSRYSDTNSIFIKPECVDIHITEFPNINHITE